jgi:hypothetical protein
VRQCRDVDRQRSRDDARHGTGFAVDLFQTAHTHGCEQLVMDVVVTICAAL